MALVVEKDEVTKPTSLVKEESVVGAPESWAYGKVSDGSD